MLFFVLLVKEEVKLTKYFDRNSDIDFSSFRASDVF